MQLSSTNSESGWTAGNEFALDFVQRPSGLTLHRDRSSDAKTGQYQLKKNSFCSRSLTSFLDRLATLDGSHRDRFGPTN